MHDPVLLGLAPTLHFHDSGAVTFLGDDVGDWDDGGTVLFAVPA